MLKAIKEFIFGPASTKTTVEPAVEQKQTVVLAEITRTVEVPVQAETKPVEAPATQKTEKAPAKPKAQRPHKPKNQKPKTSAKSPKQNKQKTQ